MTIQQIHQYIDEHANQNHDIPLGTGQQVLYWSSVMQVWRLMRSGQPIDENTLQTALQMATNKVTNTYKKVDLQLC